VASGQRLRRAGDMGANRAGDRQDAPRVRPHALVA
jgi:hypothetical protein